jgi:hypothetical protein
VAKAFDRGNLKVRGGERRRHAKTGFVSLDFGGLDDAARLSRSSASYATWNPAFAGFFYFTPPD